MSQKCSFSPSVSESSLCISSYESGHSRRWSRIKIKTTSSTRQECHFRAAIASSTDPRDPEKHLQMEAEYHAEWFHWWPHCLSRRTNMLYRRINTNQTQIYRVRSIRQPKFILGYRNESDFDMDGQWVLPKCSSPELRLYLKYTYSTWRDGLLPGASSLLHWSYSSPPFY
jgi:hypothetical protein